MSVVCACGDFCGIWDGSVCVCRCGVGCVCVCVCVSVWVRGGVGACVGVVAIEIRERGPSWEKLPRPSPTA